MKKDKEWLKEEVSDKITPYLGSTSRRFKLINLIDEMDQPKLPSIPQFVAEYIKVSKDDNESLNQAFAFIDDKENKELWNWMFPTIYEGKRENQESFARAWLDGYTVEPEKLYFMKLKDEVSDQLFLGSYKYLNVLIGGSGQTHTFDKKTGYSSFFKTKLNKEEVEIWKNKLNALDFDIVEVTE